MSDSDASGGKILFVKNLLRQILPRYLQTIFRHGYDNTGLTKSKMIFSNVFFHFQPVKVHRRTLNFKTTFGLGAISFYLFLILFFTGILIMFHYIPSVTMGPEGLPEAYQRMLNLRSNVFWGVFVRNLHRWCAHAMVAVIGLHMLRVFLTGAYKSPREFNWVIGSLLAGVTVFLSYTGYLLPWDQLAFWGVKVGTEIAKIAPGGEIIRGLLLGDNSVGSEALLRFYVLHVAVLPPVAIIFIAVHFWRIRKDGGLAKPADTSKEKLIPIEDCGDVRNNSVHKHARTYVLAEIVRGKEPRVNEEVEQMVFSWPKLIVREVILFFMVVGIMSIISLIFNAPLEGPANPSLPTNPAKAPWYFLGLQELVSYHAYIGGVIIPGLLGGLIVLFPYIEILIETVFKIKVRAGSGVWFARERWLENLIFLSIIIAMIILIIIGTYFRGPNWEFVFPWNFPGRGGH